MLNASEVTWMTAAAQVSLDQSLPYYDRTLSKDMYGNDVETYPGTPTFLLACTISKPTATQLTLFADIIAGKRALRLRYMPSSNVREGGRIVYAGVNWRVQPIQTAESYTFVDEVLIITIT